MNPVRELSFRVLSCEFRITTGCPTLHEELRFIRVNAVQDFPVSQLVEYRVERGERNYSTTVNGEVAHSFDTPRQVVSDIVYRSCRHVREFTDDAFALHAACGSYQGRRFLLVGPKWAGKSTLATRLLYEGMRIDCDEMVLVRDGLATPYPRRFHVRKASLPLLPQLAPFVGPMPRFTNAYDETVLSLEPTEIGFPWIIGSGPVHNIVYLSPGGGPVPVLKPCGNGRMLQYLLKQTYRWGSQDHSALIANLSRFLVDARCSTLIRSDIDQTVAELKQALV